MAARQIATERGIGAWIARKLRLEETIISRGIKKIESNIASYLARRQGKLVLIFCICFLP